MQLCRTCACSIASAVNRGVCIASVTVVKTQQACLSMLGLLVNEWRQRRGSESGSAASQQHLCGGRQRSERCRMTGQNNQYRPTSRTWRAHRMLLDVHADVIDLAGAVRRRSEEQDDACHCLRHEQLRSDAGQQLLHRSHELRSTTGRGACRRHRDSDGVQAASAQLRALSSRRLPLGGRCLRSVVFAAFCSTLLASTCKQHAPTACLWARIRPGIERHAEAHCRLRHEVRIDVLDLVAHEQQLLSARTRNMSRTQAAQRSDALARGSCRG